MCRIVCGVERLFRLCGYASMVSLSMRVPMALYSFQNVVLKNAMTGRAVLYAFFSFGKMYAVGSVARFMMPQLYSVRIHFGISSSRVCSKIDGGMSSFLKTVGLWNV